MGVLKGHSKPCCAHRESNPDYNLAITLEELHSTTKLCALLPMPGVEPGSRG